MTTNSSYCITTNTSTCIKCILTLPANSFKPVSEFKTYSSPLNWYTLPSPTDSSYCSPLKLSRFELACFKQHQKPSGCQLKQSAEFRICCVACSWIQVEKLKANVWGQQDSMHHTSLSSLTIMLSCLSRERSNRYIWRRHNCSLIFLGGGNPAAAQSL